MKQTADFPEREISFTARTRLMLLMFPATVIKNGTEEVLDVNS
jgi:hypothetical protein